jgi:hypothetical protein
LRAVVRRGLKRKDGRQQAGIDFFMRLVKTNIARWCIENPVGIMSSFYRKPDQIIQPYEYGDPAKKTTCLWLNNLPVLVPTNKVEPELVTLKNGKTFRNFLHFFNVVVSVYDSVVNNVITV